MDIVGPTLGTTLITGGPKALDYTHQGHVPHMAISGMLGGRETFRQVKVCASECVSECVSESKGAWESGLWLGIGQLVSAALQSLQTISRRIRHSDTVAASAYFPFLFLRLRKFLLWFGFNVLHMSGRMSSWTTTCEAVSTPPSAAAGCTITTPPPRSALPSPLGSGSEAAAALTLASDMENVVARLSES